MPKAVTPSHRREAAAQTDTLSHFYQFLAEHRRSSKPIFATITGRLVNGEDGGFVLKRQSRIQTRISIRGF
jgi:hypothetical protein